MNTFTLWFTLAAATGFMCKTQAGNMLSAQSLSFRGRPHYQRHDPSSFGAPAPGTGPQLRRQTAEHALLTFRLRIIIKTALLLT